MFSRDSPAQNLDAEIPQPVTRGTARVWRGQRRHARLASENGGFTVPPVGKKNVVRGNDDPGECNPRISAEVSPRFDCEKIGVGREAKAQARERRALWG